MCIGTTRAVLRHFGKILNWFTEQFYTFETIGEIINDICLNTFTSTGVKTKYTQLFKQGQTKWNGSCWTEGILAAKSVATVEIY